MPDPFDAVAASPAKADPFDAVAAHPAPVVAQAAADPFDAVASQPANGYAVQQDPQQDPGSVPIEEKAMNFLSDHTPDFVKDAFHTGVNAVEHSPVGTGLKYLQKPMQLMDAGVIAGMDATVSPGIKAKLNPENRWFPEVSNHDIVNYVAPTNDRAAQVAAKYGLTGWANDATRLTYAIGKTGLGLAADFLDPLMLVGAGELTEAGKLAIKAGESAKDAERYSISLGLMGKHVGLTADQIDAGIRSLPAGGKIADTMAKEGFQKGVKGAVGAGLGYSTLGPAGAVIGGTAGYNFSKVMQALDYRTGIPEVDAAMSEHASLKRGRINAVDQEFVSPLQAYKFTTGEKDLISASIEGTKNAASDEEILQAAQAHAKKNGIEVSPTRLDDIVSAAQRIKAESKQDIIDRLNAGLLTAGADGEAAGTIENYLVHKMSPEARKLRDTNPELAAAAQEVLLNRSADKVASESKLSTYDAGRFQRTLKTTLEDANKIMKEKTGLEQWFIKDPIAATAMKRAETAKLIQDKDLIDKVSKFGIEKEKVRELGLKDYKELKMPESSGSLPSSTLRFPSVIAEKVGYYVAPREVGLFTPYLDAYNRIFRNSALATPSYYIRNWGENIMKNWVQGVKIGDYVDTLRLSKAAGAIEVGDKMVPISQIKSEILKYGIDSGGQFKEGISSWLETGKKMESERVAARAAGKVKDAATKSLTLLREGGEYGENFSRRSLYINRRKLGYSPADAALDVEKYLFDYTRTSERMDTLRRFWNPFFQHAFKTLGIAPEMIRAAPGKYNFFHNNMMAAVEAAMQDPTTANEVKQIIPQYAQMQDPIVGPILTGNTWLRRIFENKTAIDNPGKMGGKTAILFKNDIGMPILNQFAMWNDDFGRQGGVAAPLLRSFVMVASGKDPWSGKSLDVTTQSADMSRRINAAMGNAISGTLAMPNAIKAVQQALGLVQPQYSTPYTVLLLHASLGKFVTVTNLDKDYLFRMLAFKKARDELTKALDSQIMAEQSGRTADMKVAGTFFQKIKAQVDQTSGSKYLDQRLIQNEVNAQKVKDNGAAVRGEMSAADIVIHLNALAEQTKILNKQYATVAQHRLETLKNASQKDIQAIVPESKGRQPQSMSTNAEAQDDADYEDQLQSQPRGKTPADEGAIRDNIRQEGMNLRDPYTAPMSGQEWQKFRTERGHEDVKWERQQSAKQQKSGQ